MLAAAVAGLAGCWADEEASSGTVSAGADTLTVAAGQSADLLGNDSVAGVAAQLGDGGNARFGAESAASGPVTLAGGRVSVAADAAPGSYRLSYTLCALADAADCASATVDITVPAAATVAGDDSLTLAPGASADLLANDRVGSATAAAGSVAASASGLPAGLSLTAGGVLTAADGMAPGSYGFDYAICQLAAPTACATAHVALVITATGVVQGRAIDAATGSAIAGATISADGTTATSDAGGSFSFPQASAGSRLSVVFRAPGYAPTARIASVAAGGRVDLQARLVRVAATLSLDAAAGGTLAVPFSVARLVLPPDALQRADGSAPAGTVSVALTPLDPAADAGVMPGDFSTLVAGSPALLESFGALDVQLTDAQGAPLQLRSGVTATLRIPLSSRSASPPATIPLYYFDEAAGRWVEDGSATLGGSGSSRWYEGTVSHFTTWNADRVYDTVQVDGCIADAAGNPVAGALLAADGVDYTGTSSAASGSDGRFRIAMRRGSQATLAGFGGGRLTNTLRIGPFAADASLPGCLALGQSGAGVTMKLTWGASPRDLDSHLFAPDGSHVFYASTGSLSAAPFANLDVDDTSSFGPEVVTITRLMVGTYKYAVFNFSGQGGGPIGSSGARVELNLPGRGLELFAPPASGESNATNWWLLFEFDVDASCNITLRRAGSFSASGPTAAAPSTPLYCTAP